MKIYDAREGGGYLYNPPPRECVASDECHGAGSAPPPPPPINTYEGTEEAQLDVPEKKVKRNCRRRVVRKRGKRRVVKRPARCVKRSRAKNHRTRRTSR
jgi:hypothetical protein